MINITEEQLKEIVTQTHMTGQHNQTGCDPSYFEAETHWQKRVKNLGIFSVSKRCSHCLYRKYRPNAKHRYELNQCQISGHNLTDVENHSCEHYKPIPNVY